MSINWIAVHQKLDAARAVLQQETAYTPEEARRILRARAQALAREPKNSEAAGGSLVILEFQLADESYGIEAAYLREVCPLKDLTPLPQTPSFVLGVINVRGQVLSVIDIKKFFDLPEKEPTDLNKVIVLQNGSLDFGILADVIVGTRSVSKSELQPSLPTLKGVREEYLMGVTKDQIVVLDATRLLSDRKIIVHQEPGV